MSAWERGIDETHCCSVDTHDSPYYLIPIFVSLLFRLAGKPVLDVYQEWRQRQLKEANVLPKGVYIESEVVRAGPKNNFQEDEEDNPKGLVTNFVREFLDGIKATVKEKWMTGM